VEELHGNVDTRLGRLAEGVFDGIVLAAAGLRRLGRERELAFRLPASVMTPAAGQGVLVLQTRDEEGEARAAASRISDPGALTELTAERAVVAMLDASCATPIGVHASLQGEQLEVDAFVGLPDGGEWLRDRVAGGADDPAALGRHLAERLVAAGADEILARAETSGGEEGGRA
jgi:hydroxymethylbilane synthase